MKNLIPAAALCLTLVMQPCLADSKSVQACKSAIDKEVRRLNAQMRQGYSGKPGERLRDQHRDALARRAACDAKKHDPPHR